MGESPSHDRWRCNQRKHERVPMATAVMTIMMAAITMMITPPDATA
jgi:hypothetical protein